MTITPDRKKLRSIYAVCHVLGIRTKLHRTGVLTVGGERLTLDQAYEKYPLWPEFIPDPNYTGPTTLWAMGMRIPTPPRFEITTGQWFSDVPRTCTSNRCTDFDRIWGSSYFEVTEKLHRMMPKC